MRGAQPWIRSGGFDLAWILGPAFLSVAWVASRPAGAPIPGIGWLILVVGIDVAHVYGTLYRTYLDRRAMAEKGGAFLIVPCLGWLAGVLLYTYGAGMFWRALAYLAVFHFVRQQYGFLRIYSRRERQSAWGRRIDQAAIYLATLYPLVFWHCHQPRSFHWFVEGDFGAIQAPLVSTVVGWAYVLALCAYAVRAFSELARSGTLNQPKHLLLAGTALSWYIGIVYLNGDLAFTVTNVVSHGIPYMALVWAVGMREGAAPRLHSISWLPAFLGLLVTAAYLEEGLWDGLIWREHPRIFSVFQWLPEIGDGAILAWLVPLLALPQITHYILDGLIWRLRSPARPIRDEEKGWRPREAFWERSTWPNTTSAARESSIAGIPSARS